MVEGAGFVLFCFFRDFSVFLPRAGYVSGCPIRSCSRIFASFCSPGGFSTLSAPTNLLSPAVVYGNLGELGGIFLGM